MSSEQLHAIVSKASEALGAKPFTQEQFAIATEPYTSKQRSFHVMAHANQMANMTEMEKKKFGKAIGDKEATPRLASLIDIAGLYHDCVYTQVDEGVTTSIAKILQKYVTQNDGVYTLRNDAAEQDKQVLEIARLIFGLKPGEALPSPVKQPLQNEFLSALVAADQMQEQGHTPASIAQVATIIEGTVPFRGKDHFYQTAERLKEANSLIHLALTDAEMDNTLKATVFEANKDVLGFAGRNATTDMTRFQQFVKSTWKLFPETNPHFRKTDYTAQEYRGALQGCHFFLTKILTAPDKQVFHEYKGYPDAHDLGELERHQQTIREACDVYLKAKSASVALMEAVATKAGVASTALPKLMQGSVDYFSETQGAKVKALRPEAKRAYEVLHTGRGIDSGFDNAPSLLGAHLLGRLGEDKVSALSNLAEEHLKVKMPPDYASFLSGAKTAMGEEEYAYVINALAEMAKTNGHTSRAENFGSGKSIP